MPDLRSLAAAALALCLATGAAAQETPFALGSFAAAEPGVSLAFEHQRTAREAGQAPRVLRDERLELEVVVGENGAPEVRIRAEGADPLSYPPVGHPLVPLFLESVVGTMAAATGGNPDYIRSRLREALWRAVEPEPVSLSRGGRPLAAERLVYRPFADDPNRRRMGPFADLELRFVFSDAVPGRLVSLELETEPAGDLPGLRERIGLAGVGR
jgi:hypothetical protein